MRTRRARNEGPDETRPRQSNPRNAQSGHRCGRNATGVRPRRRSSFPATANSGGLTPRVSDYPVTHELERLTGGEARNATVAPARNITGRTGTKHHRSHRHERFVPSLRQRPTARKRDSLAYARGADPLCCALPGTSARRRGQTPVGRHPQRWPDSALRGFERLGRVTSGPSFLARRVWLLYRGASRPVTLL
jgi:hypothetical protein